MKVAGIILILLILSGCAAQSSVVRDEQLHALMAEDVDVLMARINVLIYDQNRTVDELDRERQRNALQLIDAAGQLQLAATRIASLMPQLDLASADRTEFQNLAQRLGLHAAELEQSVRRDNYRQAGQHLQQMSLTCVACHQLYRGF